MSGLPDTEVRFRMEEREWDTRNENDNNYEDANETIEKPRKDIHANGDFVVWLSRVGGSFRVIRLPPRLKLVAMI
jgi:hypothetical protein